MGGKKLTEKGERKRDLTVDNHPLDVRSDSLGLHGGTLISFQICERHQICYATSTNRKEG